jgi:hypothetical protein
LFRAFGPTIPCYFVAHTLWIKATGIPKDGKMSQDRGV